MRIDDGYYHTLTEHLQDVLDGYTDHRARQILYGVVRWLYSLHNTMLEAGEPKGAAWVKRIARDVEREQADYEPTGTTYGDPWDLHLALST